MGWLWCRAANLHGLWVCQTYLAEQPPKIYNIYIFLFILKNTWAEVNENPYAKNAGWKSENKCKTTFKLYIYIKKCMTWSDWFFVYILSWRVRQLEGSWLTDSTVVWCILLQHLKPMQTQHCHAKNSIPILNNTGH